MKSEDLLKRLAILTFAAVGQPTEAAALCMEHPARDDEKFVIVAPRAVQAPGVKPEIIGGSIADPKMWPATMIFCSQAKTFCTSTAVGARVIVTAAHCLDEVRIEGSTEIKGRFDPASGEPLKVKCTRHPTYRMFNQALYDSTKKMRIEWSADIAVCTVSDDLRLPKYERLLLAPDRVKPNDNVTLLGLGCTLAGGGGTTETLFQGPAPIAEFISGTYYMRTRRGSKQVNKWAALCKGDSGGASYKSFSGGSRYVVGVASISGGKLKSWLTNTTAPDIINFIKTQTNDGEFAVCGVHPTARSCRDSQ